MNITEPGEYKTRGGRKAVVEFRTAADDEQEYPWKGYVIDHGTNCGEEWTDNGRCHVESTWPTDIVAKWQDKPDWLPEGCEAWDIQQASGHFRLYAIVPSGNKSCYATSNNEMPLHKLPTDARFVGFAYRFDRYGSNVEIHGVPVVYGCQGLLSTTGRGNEPIRPFAVVMRKGEDE